MVDTKIAFLKLFFFSYFFKLILEKSADENKSMKKYPGCNELTPFQPNCFVLNVVCY